MTQDKWYLIEVVKENYFTVRKFLFAGRESKNVYMSINMVSQGDYPNYRNMAYISTSKVALGPKRPLPRIRKVRFPLGTSSRQINHFLIDRYEVSNQQYRQYLTETGKINQPTYIPRTWKKGQIPSKRENHPVVGISWAQAREYAEHYAKDLPTSEQLELAALGTDGRRYPWGDISPITDNGRLSYKKEFIYLTRDKDYTTVAIDTANKDVSPFGIYHLGGNVREWTKTDGKINIKGRGIVDFFITRGAHFQKNSFQTDQYPLWAYKGKDYSPYVGFRCVKNLAGGR